MFPLIHKLASNGKRGSLGFAAGLKRMFAAAGHDRLVNDFRYPSTSPDSELHTSFSTIRGRSRTLERDNDYHRRYLQSVETNVLGAEGVQLYLPIMREDGKTADTVARQKVKDGWRDWQKKDNCTTARRLPWSEVSRLTLRGFARDGEAILLKRPGFDNPHGFALQLVEPDVIDHEYNATLSNGNDVRMGVEINPDGAAVAYYIFRRHPGDYLSATGVYGRRERIDANNVIHFFREERVNQHRGYTAACSALRRMFILGKYDEAELTMARIQACKGGFFETKENDDPSHGDGRAGADDGDDDDRNEIEVDLAPGFFQELPEGVAFKAFDPTHPNGNYPGFVKQQLHGIAAGVGQSYTSLSGDLTDVNYSSGRLGYLDEREVYKTLQDFMGSQVYDDVFESWLDNAMLTGTVALPFRKFDRFCCPVWRFRGWPWVDPEKDVKAAVEAIKNRITSPRAVMALSGRDPEDVYRELMEDEELAANMGLADAEAAKPLIEAYSLAITGGAIKATPEDEAFFRKKLGLPTTKVKG